MARRTRGATALAVADPEPVATAGPVAPLLAIIVATLESEAAKAREDVVRCKLEAAKAIEASAANPSDENSRAVHETHVQSLVAPAIAYRAERVLRDARALVNSDEVLDLDRLLTDGAGRRDSFLARLDGAVTGVRASAAALAASVKACFSLHGEHVAVNGDAKARVKKLSKRVADLHPESDLAHELARSLEAVSAKDVTFAVARGIKVELRQALGTDLARRLVQAVPFVTVPGDK